MGYYAYGDGDLILRKEGGKEFLEMADRFKKSDYIDEEIGEELEQLVLDGKYRQAVKMLRDVAEDVFDNCELEENDDHFLMEIVHEYKYGDDIPDFLSRIAPIVKDGSAVDFKKFGREFSAIQLPR